MSTLFQLHSDLPSLNQKVQDISQLYQAGDAILLLGQTLAFTEFMFIDNQMSHLTNLYGLKADYEQLNHQGQVKTDTKALLQKHSMKLITDAEWVELTQSANKVVTIS